MTKKSPAAYPRSPVNQQAARICLAFIAAIVITQGILVLAQAPADPDFGMSRIETNKTLGGTTLQNARTPAKTLITTLNYAGNVIMPLSAGVFIILAIIAHFQGRGHAGRYFVVAILCLLVAGGTRVIEQFVVNAGGAPAP